MRKYVDLAYSLFSSLSSAKDVSLNEATSRRSKEIHPHSHHPHLETHHDQEQQQCGIWMAPSTIPGAGMGMFAGHAFNQDEFVTDGDIVIPLVDWVTQNWQIDTTEILMQAYYWLNYAFTGMPEEADESLAFSHGAGAAINCYFPLYNTQGWDERTEMSSEGLHRSKDPGAGAFTPYHGRVTYATRPIRAGEELFTDYGEAYFTHNPETYGNIPLWDDYEDATEILREFVEVRDEITQSFDKVTKEVFHKELYESVVEIIKVWDSRTLNALPDKPEVVDELAIIGTNYTYWNRSVHSQEYLEENGICMDNMVVRPSELPQAGRGAFARRFIPKDSVVAPAPLIHMDETLTEMYPRDYDPETEKWWADRSEPVLHHQILMNYCFGHNRSTVLLCPYGMFTGLINHSKEKVNAKIVWSKKIMRNPEWLEKPIEEWLEEIHVGLAFDFVALRDIHPGEEIYIDYGDDWENAWREHVNNWKPPKNAESYKASFDLNADPDLVVPTFEEGSFHHDSVEMLCRDYFRTISGFYPDRKSNHYCRVLSRTEKNGEQEYTVEILERSEPEDDDYCYEELDEILFNVPRDVFYFEDIPYTRDTAQPWSFRHRMAIPNEIMPVAWLNKR